MYCISKYWPFSQLYNISYCDNLLLFSIKRMQIKHMEDMYGTNKPVIRDHKKDRKLVFKIDYRLMQVNSIAECSLGAFCNTFDLR